MYSSFFPVALLALTKVALSIPNAVLCSVITEAVGELQATSQATKFCSSYLSITPSTTVVEVTVTPTSSTTATRTVTTTSVISCASAATTISGSATQNSIAVKGKRNEYAVTARAEATETCFESLEPTLLSSACSCLSIKPSTTTITTVIVGSPTTVTKTVSATSTTVQASPTGLRYYHYVVPYKSGEDIRGYAERLRQNSSYDETGLVDDVNQVGVIPNSGRCKPPLGSQRTCNFAAVVMQGFFYARTTGRYTLNSPPVDNSGWVFTGDIAYGTSAEWSQANADYVASEPRTPASASYNLTAGQLLPITLVWINTGGPGNMGLSVIAPGGQVYNSTTGLFLPPCEQSRFVP